MPAPARRSRRAGPPVQPAPVAAVPKPKEGKYLDKWGVFDSTGTSTYGLGPLLNYNVEENSGDAGFMNIGPSRRLSTDPISFDPMAAGNWTKQYPTPSIEISDFSNAAPPNSAHHAFTTGEESSSLPTIYSASSSASSVVSGTGTNRSTFSPLLSDGASSMDAPTIVPSNWSRGPSPLSVPAAGPPRVCEQEAYLCLAPQCSARFHSHDRLEQHIKTAHSHVCNWAGCKSPSYATRDGLSWHVKADHLLICPVPGCDMTAFPNSNVIGIHVKSAHPSAVGELEAASKQAAQANNLPQATPLLPANGCLSSLSTGSSQAGLANPPKLNTAEEKAKMMNLSITRSKERCRRQLREVLERRMKRMNRQQPSSQFFGSSPRSIESPPGLVRSRTPKLVEQASFPLIWEHGVLPFLIEFVPKWCGPGHVISVTRGKTTNARRICIMTRKKVSRARKIAIAAHVRDLLPTNHRQTVCFTFATGEVDRLVWARGLSREMPDDLCQPRNPFYYVSPCMGDSIGTVVSEEEGESTSTLGPCILMGGESYWLANFHPFIKSQQLRDLVTIEHPSPKDRSRCVDEGHDSLSGPDSDFRLGTLTATCGLDLKTTRLSHDPYWEDMDKEPPLIVTDWTIITSHTRQANMLRKFPSTSPRMSKEVPVTSTTTVQPGSVVQSTGRTSGHQRGQICEIPAYVSGDNFGNGSGRATREWFIEEPEPYDNEEGWIRGGIGVEGDSGAAIVDAVTNGLVGTLWGRNKYFGSGPRHTFFTPISDIFDDIQEKCGEQTRPQLPQWRDEGERYAVYPACRPCFDLRTYLDSRRSSRESLRSIIGRHDSDGMGHGDDAQDLISLEGISELATPKDQNYWLRHTGAEEAGMSFMNFVSPRPITSFAFDSRAASPGVADMRSPYAVDISTEDLYDAEYAPPTATNAKRPALPLPAPSLMRSSSSGGSKRQRTQ
ncbi:putative zinc finger protein 585a protein [Phaeoacremonium minimum UCRPA7]|uniref:Putative zinc finger protein 585a protein n=1 Tax=Phaeoacremonium minimum (strain UCR-PA7) TaxID=1286976 RepID=R8BGI8_PHAM7|nr:putative zinc finger protein 585a protein [Phaeoacremonium minimum UCRPA7]EON98450.1 putative zinc finger protein 585a protein [Phaeoacremonium minimum UCRPA7]